MSITIKNKMSVKGKLTLGAASGTDDGIKTDDTWWQDGGVNGLLSWDGTAWFPSFAGGLNLYSLAPVTAGPNANWTSGFTASSVDVVVSIDNAYGWLGDPNAIDFRTAAGSVGQVAWSFESFNETKTFNIPLTLAGNDITGINIETDLYGVGGFQLESIVFNA